MKRKICESCGMPMKKTEDFGGGDLTNRYCKYCTDEKGILKPYDIKLEEMTRFIMSRSGAVFEAAQETARQNMAGMPAWKDV